MSELEIVNQNQMGAGEWTDQIVSAEQSYNALEQL